MRADGNRSDGPLGVAFEDFPNSLYLFVYGSLLRGRQRLQRLNGDCDFLARTTLVPNTGNSAANEQHRKVARLTTGKRTLSRTTEEEQLARMAANGIGVKIRE